MVVVSRPSDVHPLAIATATRPAASQAHIGSLPAQFCSSRIRLQRPVCSRTFSSRAPRLRQCAAPFQAWGFNRVRALTPLLMLRRHTHRGVPAGIWVGAPCACSLHATNDHLKLPPTEVCFAPSSVFCSSAFHMSFCPLICMHTGRPPFAKSTVEHISARDQAASFSIPNTLNAIVTVTCARLVLLVQDFCDATRRRDFHPAAGVERPCWPLMPGVPSNWWCDGQNCCPEPVATGSHPGQSRCHTSRFPFSYCVIRISPTQPEPRLQPTT